ncbi:MAG: ROK family protein [Clostridia bacterium]|nr:ROK family protein [Clostridia bacterium]
MLIGIDIGGTKCAVILGTESGEVITKEKFATTNVSDTVDRILSSAKKLAQGNAVKACGVSCGGPLDEKNGIILSPPNLPGWDRIRIKELLENALGVPCGVRNDANACAMAEWRYGAGRGCENMVFLTFGTGLGAGIIIGGKLYSGTNAFAGEVGHMRLEDDGPEGYGKKGSFEGFCSGGGIKRLGKIYAAKAEENGEKVPWAAGDFSAADIAVAAREGDKTAKAVYDKCAEKLGQGLSTIIDILNPERIVIGSIYARSHDLLDEKMYEVLKKETLPAPLSACKILPAELGEAIGDMAALGVAAEVCDGLH